MEFNRLFAFNRWPGTVLAGVVACRIDAILTTPTLRLLADNALSDTSRPTVKHLRRHALRGWRSLSFLVPCL